MVDEIKDWLVIVLGLTALARFALDFYLIRHLDDDE